MKKKLLALIVALGLCFSIPAAAAQVYYFEIEQLNVGYDAGLYQKVIDTNHGFFRIRGTGNDAAHTNFLIKDYYTGTQLTNNKNVANSSRVDHYLYYYSSYVNANTWTQLRANNGSTYYGYYVYGDWNPNG